MVLCHVKSREPDTQFLLVLRQIVISIGGTGLPIKPVLESELMFVAAIILCLLYVYIK